MKTLCAIFKPKYGWYGLNKNNISSLQLLLPRSFVNQSRSFIIISFVEEMHKDQKAKEKKIIHLIIE